MLDRWRAMRVLLSWWRSHRQQRATQLHRLRSLGNPRPRGEPQQQLGPRKQVRASAYNSGWGRLNGCCSSIALVCMAMSSGATVVNTITDNFSAGGSAGGFPYTAGATSYNRRYSNPAHVRGLSCQAPSLHTCRHDRQTPLSARGARVTLPARS